MVAAILKFPAVIVLPVPVVTLLMPAVAPVIWIIAVPCGMPGIPGIIPPPFVSVVVVVAVIVVVGMAVNKERQEDHIKVEDNTGSVIVALFPVDWTRIVNRCEHYAATVKLIIPVTVYKNIASGRPYIMRGYPDPIGPLLKPIPRLPDIVVVIPDPMTLNPHIVR